MNCKFKPVSYNRRHAVIFFIMPILKPEAMPINCPKYLLKGRILETIVEIYQYLYLAIEKGQKLYGDNSRFRITA